VVSNAVRQLQFCVTERNAVECLELFQLESRNHATGGQCSNAHKRAAAENAYHRRAEASLQEEAYFKVFIVSCTTQIQF
jgi:paired amphipathic helix protein Sin3a